MFLYSGSSYLYRLNVLESVLIDACKVLYYVFLLIDPAHIVIEHAMFGRLVADDGSAETCPHINHLNNINCTGANRSATF